MYNNHYLLYRARVVQELNKVFYQEGNLQRCRKRVWDHFAKPLVGISYDNYLCCLKVDTSSLDSEGTELISQLIESIREKFQHSFRKSPASLTRNRSISSQETIRPYRNRKQMDNKFNCYYLYRARVVQELCRAFYERENRCRNHRAVWRKFAKHLLGISYDTYLSYLRVDTSGLNPEESEFIAQLFESIKDKRFQSGHRFCYESTRKSLPSTRSFSLPSQKSERLYQSERQAKLTELGLEPVREKEMRTDRVYRFYTAGAVYDVEDSVTAQFITKDSENKLCIGPVLTIFGFIPTTIPLPEKYTLVREATEEEIKRFARFQCSHLNVERNPKKRR